MIPAIFAFQVLFLLLIIIVILISSKELAGGKEIKITIKIMSRIMKKTQKQPSPIGKATRRARRSHRAAIRPIAPGL
jgi:hypothetical protein